MPANGTDSDRFARNGVVDDPEIAQWLRAVGLIEIEDQGNWKLTNLGEEAMARFYGGPAGEQSRQSGARG